MVPVTEDMRIISSLKAAADLSTKQFHCVTVSGEFKVNTAAAGGRVTGVLWNKPEFDGAEAAVVISGITKVEAGAAVTAGDALMSNAAGEAVPATGANTVFGIALMDAADGERLSVLLGHP